MTERLGRLIDHPDPVLADRAASRRLHAAPAAALGTGVAVEDGPGWSAMDEPYASEAGGELGASPVARHPGAFALESDGDNVEAVCHGPVARPAPSVAVARGP